MIDHSTPAKHKVPRAPEIIRKKKTVAKDDTFAFSGPGKGAGGFGKLSNPKTGGGWPVVIELKKEAGNGPNKTN